MQVGQSTAIRLVATPGSGDTVQYTYINQSVNGGAQTNVVEATGGTDNYTFAPTTAGTYVFYGWAYTAAYPYWYNPPGATVTVTVNPEPTCSVTLSPNPIDAGQSSTLSYTSSNASWTYISNVGYVSPNTSGSFSVSPNTTTSYACTVADASGNQFSFPASLTVYQLPMCTLAVSPSSIAKGASATLTYSSANVTSFSITPSIGTVTQNNTNTASVSPNTTTTYTGSVSGPGGSASCTVPAGSTNTLTVSCTPSTTWSCTGAGNETIASTTVSASCAVTTNNLATCASPGFCLANASVCQYPSPVPVSNGSQTGNLAILPSLTPAGQTVQIYWDIANVQNCSITGTNGDSWSMLTSGAAGKTSSPIKQQTTYTLSCLGDDGVTHLTQTATVNVVPSYQER
jgi:mucin-2